MYNPLSFNSLHALAGLILKHESYSCLSFLLPSESMSKHPAPSLLHMATADIKTEPRHETSFFQTVSAKV